MKRIMILGASLLQLPAIKKAKEMGLMMKNVRYVWMYVLELLDIHKLIFEILFQMKRN